MCKAGGLPHPLCAVPVRSDAAGGARGCALVLHMGRPRERQQFLPDGRREPSDRNRRQLDGAQGRGRAGVSGMDAGARSRRRKSPRSDLPAIRHRRSRDAVPAGEQAGWTRRGSHDRRSWACIRQSEAGRRQCADGEGQRPRPHNARDGAGSVAGRGPEGFGRCRQEMAGAGQPGHHGQGEDAGPAERSAAREIRAGAGRQPAVLESAKYGLPWNLDSWSGFPVARERLYAAAKAAKAKLVTLTGDTHTAWANELHDVGGQKRGVEFGCTSVTSNGAGDNMPFEEINFLMPEANDEVVYYDAFSKGYTLLTLKADQVEAEFIKVSTVRSPDYLASTDAKFIARTDEVGGMGGLQRPMGGGVITRS